MKDLASLLAKKEGKKLQAHIGNVREINGYMSDVLYEEYLQERSDIYFTLLNNGKRRYKAKNKSKSLKKLNIKADKLKKTGY